MKISPVQTLLPRGAQSWAAALLAAGLCVSIANAQSPSAAGPATSESNLSGQSASDRKSGSTSGGSMSAGASTSAGAGSSDNASMSSTTRDNNTGGASLKRADRRFLTKAVESNQREIAASQLAASRASDPQVRSFAQQLTSEHQRMSQELMQLAQSKGVTLESMGLSAGSMTAGMSTSGTRATDTGVTGTTGTSTNSGLATDNGAPRATGAAGTSGTGAGTGMATNSSTATSGGVAGSGSASVGASAAAADIQDRHVRNLARKSGQEFDRDYVDLIVDAHEDSVRLFQRASKDAQDPEIRSFASKHVASLQSHLDHANSLMRSAAE